MARLFGGNTPHRPSDEGVITLRSALQEVRGKGVAAIPIWTVSYNAAEVIANAAKARGAHRRQPALGLLTIGCEAMSSKGS